MFKIKKLHHSAYRCKDSEQTREFYEEFLGLPLVKAFEINITKSNRKVSILHSFYQLNDKSHIAFFEEPSKKFKFKEQRDFDLHIALEVSMKSLLGMYQKGINKNIDTRGIIDHGFIKSIYFRDPNGYVIELTCPITEYSKKIVKKNSHQVLKEWQNKKEKPVY